MKGDRVRTIQGTSPRVQQSRGHIEEYTVCPFTSTNSWEHVEDYTVYPSMRTTAERTSWILHSVSIQEYNSREDSARTTHAVYTSTDITSIIIIIITKETIDYIAVWIKNEYVDAIWLGVILVNDVYYPTSL